MKPAVTLIGAPGSAARRLILLAGAYMQAADFVDAGFFAAVTRRRLSLDLQVVGLDLAAISSGEALPALQAQVLAPAREKDGCRDLWLGGISLGGLLALCQCADHPGSVDGLCLLAPYPGSRLTTRAIEAAGGLDRWRPSGEQLADPEFRVWRWLQAPPATLPVFVGYGADDRFAPALRKMAACFPPAASHVVPGGHQWPVWKQLWDHFLDRLPPTV